MSRWSSLGVLLASALNATPMHAAAQRDDALTSTATPPHVAAVRGQAAAARPLLQHHALAARADAQGNLTCANCGLNQKTTTTSCCHVPGSWLNRCATTGNTNASHPYTWKQGVKACQGRAKPLVGAMPRLGFRNYVFVPDAAAIPVGGAQSFASSQRCKPGACRSVVHLALTTPPTRLESTGEAVLRSWACLMRDTQLTIHVAYTPPQGETPGWLPANFSRDLSRVQSELNTRFVIQPFDIVSQLRNVIGEYETANTSTQEALAFLTRLPDFARDRSLDEAFATGDSGAHVENERMRYKLWPIHSSDLIRYVLLYRFGGFYTDWDIVLVKPLPHAWLDSGFIGFQSGPDEGNIHSKLAHHRINGAIMGTPPRHPWIRACIEEFIRIYPVVGSTPGPKFGLYGPMLITRVTHRGGWDTQGLTILPAHVFQPLAAGRRTRACMDEGSFPHLRPALRRSYAVHLNNNAGNKGRSPSNGSLCAWLFGRTVSSKSCSNEFKGARDALATQAN